MRIKAEVNKDGDYVLVLARGPRGAIRDVEVLKPNDAWVLIRQLADAAHEVERRAAS